MLCKRCFGVISAVASCPEKELQCFIEHVTNFNSSIKCTYAISINTVTFIDLQMTIDKNHTKSCVNFKPTDSHKYFLCSCKLPPSYKHSIHFHKCCESIVVVLTMTLSLRSQIKSLITFLVSSTSSISFSQPLRMLTHLKKGLNSKRRELKKFILRAASYCFASMSTYLYI